MEKRVGLAAKCYTVNSEAKVAFPILPCVLNVSCESGLTKAAGVLLSLRWRLCTCFG
jgi:hypothetical protein